MSNNNAVVIQYLETLRGICSLLEKISYDETGTCVDDVIEALKQSPCNPSARRECEMAYQTVKEMIEVLTEALAGAPIEYRQMCSPNRFNPESDLRTFPTEWKPACRDPEGIIWDFGDNQYRVARSNDEQG